MKRSDVVLFTVILTIMTIAGCDHDDEGWSNRRMRKAEVACFSGGTEIYRGTTIGSTSFYDNRFMFTDAKTKKLTEIRADCIITYE